MMAERIDNAVLLETIIIIYCNHSSVSECAMSDDVLFLMLLVDCIFCGVGLQKIN